MTRVSHQVTWTLIGYHSVWRCPLGQHDLQWQLIRPQSITNYYYWNILLKTLTHKFRIARDMPEEHLQPKFLANIHEHAEWTNDSSSQGVDICHAF